MVLSVCLAWRVPFSQLPGETLAPQYRRETLKSAPEPLQLLEAHLLGFP